MRRRTLLATIGLAAVTCLGGCVVHGHGHNGVQTRTTHGLTHRLSHSTTPRTTHNPRVLNVTPRSYPHFHHGHAMHSHVGGNETHDHDKSAWNRQDYPAHQRGYHEDGDRGKAKGHAKDRGTGHTKGRGKGHGKNRD